ncbi:MAG: hypothetical protein GY870_12090 [archaeon]|nr:hypothetical protein [archaeon]
MGKTYALMFTVEDGGVSTPVDWGDQNLTPDNIVMAIDEESLCVWLWYGKNRGLVSRRTAMRQAQSLKGHGYTIGKSLIGRGMNEIVEIDSRKIGRVPEEDEKNNKFMSLLKKPITNVGNCVVTFGDGAADSNQFEANMKSKSTPASAPAPKPQKAEPVVMPKPKSVAPPKSTSAISEYDESSVTVPEPASTPVSKPEVTKPVITTSKDDAQMGLVIMAVLSEFKDIWASKKEDGSIAIEQMDGKVCHFLIEGGKVKFKPGSFNEIDPALKETIQKKFFDLIKIL